MSYYPVVGDICRYESPNDNRHYLIMDVREEDFLNAAFLDVREEDFLNLDVREEDFLNRKQIVAHLLCLNDGEHFPDYIWPVNNIYWQKVA
jgi:hypothetical protein